MDALRREKRDLKASAAAMGEVSECELLRGGEGRPLLVLHGFHPLPPDSPFLCELARHAEVIAPSLPGFGGTRRPEALDTVYDLARFCLDLIDDLGLEAFDLVGFSFGGWLALELAVMGSPVRRLALADSVGVKLNERETSGIADVFNLHPDEVRARSWHDPSLGNVDFDAMSDDAIVAYVRDRESLCLYAWEPYMHTPALRHWLHRIRVPSLILWGESDRIVDVNYGRALAERLGDARFETVPNAGHHPELERPTYLAERLAAFLGTS